MYTKDNVSTFEDGVNKEWLITNGIGGFASSTIIGANTRKYHGLLVASLKDEENRMFILSKINEYISINGTEHTISSNECHEYIQKGYTFQKKFIKEYLPEFFYIVEDVAIRKKIAMVHGKNKVVVEYDIENDNGFNVEVKLMPLVNYRSYHNTSDAKGYNQKYYDDLFIELEKGYVLKIHVDESSYESFQNVFYDDMYYRIENERGLDDTEKQNIPGVFKIDIPPREGKKIIFTAEVEKENEFVIPERQIDEIKQEEIRLKKVCRIASAKDEITKDLVIAADNFIINKNSNKTIIAGYPWFSDWGRDTFIAFENLVLKTNRYSDAKDIVLYFSKYIKDGLVPNFVNDFGGQAYNSVDSSLWYIEAVYKYYKYTNDTATIELIYPKLKEVIDSYIKGTLYNIKMDSDGLIMAGDASTQLTWMDAKIGDVIPTPRYGKAVDINALWYNALKIMEELSSLLKMKFDFELSKKVKQSFKKFYADSGLLDTIEPFNSQIRPNQLFAIGLTFPVVTGDKAKEILDFVTEKLYTNKGIKTLDASDENYKSKYEGDVYKRDMSYHQGTIWPWLLILYTEAYERIYMRRLRVKSLDEFITDRCVGNVSEIYDAEEPRCAKGAFAQAWSVAALIRIIM